MSERASYFKLGVFVISSVALLLVGLTLLGAGAFMRDGFRCETYFDESVQGLDVGAAVKHRGVTIGRVTRISFVRETYPDIDDITMDGQSMANFVLVEMEMDSKVANLHRFDERLDRAVNAGLRARMATAGLLGATYVELVFMEPARYPVPELDWQPRQPYIPGAPSFRAELTTAAERLARQLEDANFEEIVSNINTFIVSLNQGLEGMDIPAMQNEIMSLAAELRETNQRIKAIVDNEHIDDTIKHIAGITQTTERILSEREFDLQTFLEDLPKITARLKNTTEQVEAFLADEKTQKIFDNLAEASEAAPATVADLRRVLRRTDALLASQQDDLAGIIISLRKTLENLENMSEEAREHPARLLFGEPPPRIQPGEQP